MNLILYLSSISKLLFLCLTLCLIVFSCSSSLADNTSVAKTRKIVKIKNKNGSIVRFTDKYQRSSLKALPIVITTGLIEGERNKFTEIEFRSYNRKKPLNYEFIEMYNIKGDKWEWFVKKSNKTFIKKRNFTIELYRERIDSKVQELEQFFQHQPVYLKYGRNTKNFKRLDSKHVNSLIKILNFAAYSF